MATLAEEQFDLVRDIEGRGRTARRRALLFTVIPFLIGAVLIWITGTSVIEAQQTLELAQQKLGLVKDSIRQAHDSLAVLKELRVLLQEEIEIKSAKLDSLNPELAKQTDENIRDMQIANIFADQAAVRKASVSVLLREGRANPSLVSALLDYAERDLSNRNGIYNTLFILSEVEQEALLAHQERMHAFLDSLAVGPRTKKLFDVVSSRLPTS